MPVRAVLAAQCSFVFLCKMFSLDLQDEGAGAPVRGEGALERGARGHDPGAHGLGGRGEGDGPHRARLLVPVEAHAEEGWRAGRVSTSDK